MKVLKLISKELSRAWLVTSTWEGIALQKRLTAEAGHHIDLHPEIVEVEEQRAPENEVLTSRGEKFEDLRRRLRSEWEPWLESPAEEEKDNADSSPKSM